MRWKRAAAVGALGLGASTVLLVGACGLSGGSGDVALAEAGDGTAAHDVRAPLDATSDLQPTPDAGSDGAAGSDVTDAGSAPDQAMDAPAVSQITFVQEVSAPMTNGQSLAASATVVTGHLLVVAVYWDGNSSSVTVTDTLGNTFSATQSGSQGGCGPGEMQIVGVAQIWYAQNAHGGSDTITVTQPSTGALGFYVLEYAGVAKVAPLDVQANRQPSTFSNVMSPGNLVTTGSLDLIVAVFGDLAGSGLMTAGTGYTARGTDTAYYSLVEDNVPGVGPGTHTPTAYLPSGTNDACWNATGAAFVAE